MRTLEVVLALVVLAMAVAVAADRWRFPAPPLLVLAGVGAGYLPGVPTVRVSPGLIMLVVLPPLLYAAGQEVELPALRAVWAQVTALSTGLVIASAVCVAAVGVGVLGLRLDVALVLGAVLASTDPVAVTALGRNLRLPVRVRTLVQAESLFNDATSLVLFTLVLGLVTGAHPGPGGIALRALRLVGGGVALGAAVAGLLRVLRPHLSATTVAVAAELIAPYVAYVVAQAVGGSGVTGVVTAALLVGSAAPGRGGATVRLRTSAVSATAVFLLESVVFAVIGLQLPGLVRSRGGGVGGWLWPSLLLVLALIGVRAAWVLGSELGRRRYSWAAAAVASWAGTRGVVPLAAALSLPLSAAGGRPFPDRTLLLLVATSVVVLTVVVQGLTLGPLVRRSGLARPARARADEEATARLALTRAALTRLDALDAAQAAPPAVLAGLRARSERRLAPGGDEERAARVALLAAERAELARLRSASEVSEPVRRRLEQVLDLEEAALPPPAPEADPDP